MEKDRNHEIVVAIRAISEEIRKSNEALASAVLKLQKLVDQMVNSGPRKPEPVSKILQESVLPEKATADQPEHELSTREIPATVSTGNEKVDELLIGGIRTGSNCILIGPPFSGKYILAWNFVATSLREGVPVIVITTDKDVKDIKYEISKIYRDVDLAEENGLLRFVDVYSRTIQGQPSSKFAVVIDNIVNVSSLIKNVDLISADMVAKKGYYRLLFSSLTSYMTELDEKILLKFIQQFVQKRRGENGTSFYLLEGGLFDQKLTEAVVYTMDGSIEFKNEGSKFFLRVSGLGSARSRDWVELFMSETSFDLGSFTLEKIR
ncbi:MAG: RAD55 family ATPase [Candidatus Thermoplasmatota archaeon]|nr:RAD55 family ATPase [Candidatus Thermoplasmatota archaeon]MCL5731476.1 RAD55 family ATPase [Candidatus Thermoplasmatota archaeon]